MIGPFHSDARPPVDIEDYLCYRGMPVQFRNARQFARTWPCDGNGNLILLSLPETVDLSTPDVTPVKEKLEISTTTTLTSLPRELHWAIFDHLIPVDRVCLGLSCKTLAASLISSPRLSPSAWPCFVDCGYNFFIPETYHLIQRLAHGWVNKHDFRYCWKCRKILPRDATFFQKRLRRKKLPRWNVKVALDKEAWQRLSKKQRYAHLVKLWCEADWEDSSCYSCNDCRPQYIDACRDRILKFVEQQQQATLPLGSYQPNMHQAIQCPCCLEEELTWHFRQPKKPRKQRIKEACPPLLWEILDILRVIVTVIFVGFVCVIYYAVTGPWKFGKVAWKKLRSSQRLSQCLRRVKRWVKH